MMDLRIEGVPATQDYLEQVRQRILAGVRAGMFEGMDGLAATMVERLSEAVTTRTGELAAALLRNPRVFEKEDEYIEGSEVARTGNKHSSNLGLWLEFGTSVPATVQGKFGKLFSFTAADGDSVYTHGHKAFQVAPHPFFNEAFREYYQTILDTIN